MSVSAVNLREAFHAGRKVRLHGIHLPAATRTTGGKPATEEMMAEQNFGAVPEANPGGYNFGTFGGVYTPALLTILGLVMFMRINFVLGEAGLFRTILILAIGASITFATGLSIAAIATNTEVKGGGAYYLISRVLGPSFGTSIGLTLFISQTLAIPFNILGASEAIIDGWPGLRPWFPLVNTVLGVLLMLLVWKGADWAIKAQYFIMGVLALSVIFFLAGPLGEFSWENLRTNWGPVSDSVNLVTFFAIFFPAVTGIMAGVNMSGDLRDPHHSIPRGTLLALGTAVVLYLIQIVVAAGCFDRQEMIDHPYLILTRNSLFGMGFMVFAGVQAATLSTALGWLLGAPRVLQSLGVDNVLPGIGFFRAGVGPQNEPRRAILLTAVLVLPILIWAGYIGSRASGTADSPITVMSELVSLFFLFTYAIINVAAFVESFGANPSFRPRFRAFHWTIALYGAAACVAAAFLIDLTLSTVALLVIIALYGFIRYRNLEMSYGDARRGFVYSRIHSLLLQLPKLPLHPKNWRPTIVVLSSDPERRGQLIEYAILFSQRRGILSVIQILISDDPRHIRDRRTPRLRAFRELARQRNWPIFPTVVIAPEFDVALRIILQSHSLDPIRPNIVLMGWPTREERVPPFFTHLHTIVEDFRRNVLVLINERATFTPQRYDGGTIDIWWQSSAGGSLMTILAYLVQLDRNWRKSVLRIFLPMDREKERKIRKVLDAARIEAELVRIEEDAKLRIVVPRYSTGAELVFIEFPDYSTTDERRQRITHQLIRRDFKNLPPCFLVVSNGEADLLA